MRRHFLALRACARGIDGGYLADRRFLLAGPNRKASSSSKSAPTRRRAHRTVIPIFQGVWAHRHADGPGAARRRSRERPALTEAEAKAFVANASSAETRTRNDPARGPYNRIISYNDFWLDRGSMLTRINGEYRTGMVVDPPDGKVPPMTAEGEGATLPRLASDLGRRTSAAIPGSRAPTT